MKLYVLMVSIMACCSMYGASPELEITLAHGTPEEMETRGQLQRLLNTFHISGWTWTRKVLIDKDAIPHSHPVLTLHTRHVNRINSCFQRLSTRNTTGVRRRTRRKLLPRLRA